MNQLNLEVRKLLYMWLDVIPFSRPKTKLARFFADASMVAELINFFFPKFVFENAYPACLAMANKIDNWERLNRKVLQKLGIKLSKDLIKELAGAKLEATEAFLCRLVSVIHSRKQTIIRRELQKNSSRLHVYSYLQDGLCRLDDNAQKHS